MLKLTTLLILLLVVWLVASSGITTNPWPYIDSGMAALRELAERSKRGVEERREQSKESKQVEDDNEIVLPDTGNPSQSSSDPGVVNDNEGSADRSVTPDGPMDTRRKRKELAQEDEILDLYEQAKVKLFEAMSILEGK